MQDLSRELPFSPLALASALSLTIPENERCILQNETQKLRDHLKNNPIVDHTDIINTIIQRSIRFAKDITSTTVMTRFLIAGSTCRSLHFNGYTKDQKPDDFNVNEPHMTNFSITSIGKTDGPHSGRVKYDKSCPDSRQDSWIRIVRNGNHTTYTAEGPCQTIIRENLILTTSGYFRQTNTTYNQISLLLPVHGDNLFWHPCIAKMVQDYISDLPYDYMLSVWETEQNNIKIKKLMAEIYHIKSSLSQTIQSNNDYQEIIGIHHALQKEVISDPMTKEAMTILRRGLDRIPDVYAPKIRNIFKILRTIPDEDDRAIAWIGLANGAW